MIVLAALVLGIFIFLSTGVLVKAIRKMDKSDTACHATMKCLIDLVNKLNEKFPGSNLTVNAFKGDVNVTGELKYLIKHDN